MDRDIEEKVLENYVLFLAEILRVPDKQGKTYKEYLNKPERRKTRHLVQNDLLRLDMSRVNRTS